MTTHLACFQNSAVPIIKLSSRKTHYRSELLDLRNEVEEKKKLRRRKKKKKEKKKQRKGIKDEEKKKEKKARLDLVKKGEGGECKKKS